MYDKIVKTKTLESAEDVSIWLLKNNGVNGILMPNCFCLYLVKSGTEEAKVREEKDSILYSVKSGDDTYFVCRS